MITAKKRVEVSPAVEGRGAEVFTAEALEFISDLHRRFNPTRLDLLRRRVERQAQVDRGKTLRFRPETRRIRDDSWSIAAVPADLVDRGTGPYFYLPKMESHLEARLWNDVFAFAEDAAGVRRGTIKGTALIETFPAAFEMEEILYELRDHAAGLNAGRWDYLFSIMKTLRARRDFVLPDRAQLTMTVPFMRRYTELLVKTCHRRRAHAIGGMAAFVPSRRDPKANEVAFAKV